MEPVSIVCPDCRTRRTIGFIAASKREDFVVKARVRGVLPKRLLRVPGVREHKARFGRVPDTQHFVTVPLQLEKAPTTDILVAFECPKHGSFELSVKTLRDAALSAHAKGKAVHLPAHRKSSAHGRADVWAEKKFEE